MTLIINDLIGGNTLIIKHYFFNCWNEFITIYQLTGQYSIVKRRV